MNTPTKNDLKKLKKEISISRLTCKEMITLFAVSLLAIISIFGIPFLEPAWKGMRANQRSKRLNVFAKEHDMSVEDAEKLIVGYSLFTSHKSLLKKVYRPDDCERVRSLVYYLAYDGSSYEPELRDLLGKLEAICSSDTEQKKYREAIVDKINDTVRRAQNA